MEEDKKDEATEVTEAAEVEATEAEATKAEVTEAEVTEEHSAEKERAARVIQSSFKHYKAKQANSKVR